jgi:hypothetical protein
MDTGFNEVAQRPCGPKQKEIREKLKNINSQNLASLLKYYYCVKKGERNGWIIWRAREDCILFWNT